MMSRASRIAALLLALLVLTACTVGPDYVRPAVDAPERFRYQPGEAEALVNTQWWRQFEDPALDALVDTALENNRDVRIAAARVEEFAARVDITRAGFYPQIGYDAAAGRSQVSRNSAGYVPGADRIGESYTAALNVGWELDIWGKIRRASEAARADLLAAEAGRQTVILTLVSSVATSYVNLRALDKRLAIAKRTLRSRGETVKLFEAQYAGGVVSDLTLSQIRSEYEQAAVRVPSLERQIALLENAISVLLGQNPGPIARGKTIDQLIEPGIPAGVPSELLARRPDIRLSEQNLIAANARIGVARAQYFPTIGLTGTAGYASSALDNLISSGSGIWGIGGALLGPIFSGGQIEGQVRASEAVQRQALVTYIQDIQTAFREVDDALISVRKGREELAAQGRQVKALKDYARYANLRYKEGYVSYIEVLDAERRLFDTELLYTQTQADVFGSLIATYKAMGGGWVLEAENVANAVDYPQAPQDKSGFRLHPARTQPDAAQPRP